jgi:hypothetical protein
MRLAVASLMLCASACARSPRDEATPLPVPADAGAILLLGVEMPAAGSTLGGHYAGNNFESRVSSYQLTDAARLRWAQSARAHGEAVLRGLGYHVHRGGPASSDAQLLRDVQYGLAGRVQSLQVRTTGPAEPYRVDAQVVIGWELLDLGSGRAVFGRVMHGTSRATATVDDVVGQALDESLLRLGSDTAFLRAVTAPRADPDADRAPRFVRPLPPGQQIITLTMADQHPTLDSGIVGRMVAGIVTLRGPDNVYGTAFLLTRDGLAIALARSVRHARQLRARLQNGVERPVRVVRSHGGLDVALVQIACPGECDTVDWETPTGVDVATNVVAVGAPPSDNASAIVAFGRMGGRWGLANGLTVQGFQGVVVGGEPVARTTSGKVFGVISARPGRPTVLTLAEVLSVLNVRFEN